MTHRTIPYHGQRVYPRSVAERATGEYSGDRWAEWDVVRAILPEPVGLDVHRSTGFVVSLFESFITLTPPVLPRMYAVVEGDAEGNADYLASNLSLDAAMNVFHR